MSPMKFRRTCSSCNSTFFAEDRRAPYCPKCARKKAATRPAPEAPSPQTAPRLVKGRPGGQPGHSGSSGAHAGGHASTQVRAAPSARPARPVKQQRPPKATEMTDELRAKIEAAYQQLKGSVESIKKLHAQISHDLWVKPKLVADVVNVLRAKQPSTEVCTLSAEDRQRVIDRYLTMVREGVRPPEGRRPAIAVELALPPREVVLAVREWSNSIMGQLSRQQLFTIEKTYWRIINNGEKPADLSTAIVEQVGFATREQVNRWLDQLHDGTKVQKARPTTPEQQQQIIDGYHQYLASAEPPPLALHTTLAKSVGVTPMQVHRVLCDYRCQMRNR